MAAHCNVSGHFPGDLNTRHNISRLTILNDELALSLLPVTIYLGVLMFLGVFGNLIVWYVYYFRFKKTPSNYFVLCLATLDLLTCLFASPFEIFDVTKPLMFDMPVACKIMRFLETITTVASGITLVAVAHDRHRKVFKPFKRISNKQAKIVSYVSVAIGLFVAWPTILIYGSHHVKTKDSDLLGISCSLSDCVQGSIYPKLYSGFLLLLFFGSVGVLIVLYTKVGLEIRKRGNMRLSQTPTSYRTHDASMSMEVAEESSSGECVPGQNKAQNKKQYRMPSFPKLKTQRSNSCEPKRPVRIRSSDEPGSPRDLNTSVAVRSGYNPGKTTRILFCVSVAFVLSFLPYVIVKIVQAATKNFDASQSVAALLAYNFATRSFVINAAVNPIIYSYLNESFRDECKGFIHRCCKRFKKWKV